MATVRFLDDAAPVAATIPRAPRVRFLDEQPEPSFELPTEAGMVVPEQAPDPELDTYYRDTSRLSRVTDPLKAGLAQVRQGSAALGADVSSRHLRTFDTARGTEPGAPGAPMGGMMRVMREQSPEQAAATRETIAGNLADSATRVVDQGRALSEIPQNPAARKFAQAKSWEEGAEQFWRDPIGAIQSIGVQSLAASAPGLIAGVIGGPAAGATVMGGSSFLSEYAGSVLESLGEDGVNLGDRDALIAAFQNPELMERARAKAATRGAIVGAVDALTMGIASRTLAPRAITSPLAREVANIPAQTAAQGLAGGGAEATAQLVTEGEIRQPGQVLAEVAGEAVGAPVEVASLAGHRPQRVRYLDNTDAPPSQPDGQGMTLPGAGAPERAEPQSAQAPQEPGRPGPSASDLRSVLDDDRTVEEIMAEREERAALQQEELTRDTLVSQVEQETGDTAIAQAFRKAIEGKGARAAPMHVETKADVDAAAAQTDPEPTPAQAEAGNYRKGHIKVQGLDIAIETARGDERTGIGRDGRPWSNVSPAHYGYIKRTLGKDGDQVDVYVGDNPQSDLVVVVDQIDPETGRFDEGKVILGADSRAEAVALYDGGFSDGSGANRRGAVTTMTVPEFKAWLAKGDTKKPLAYRPAAPAASPAVEPAAPPRAPASPAVDPGAVAPGSSPGAAIPVGATVSVDALDDEPVGTVQERWLRRGVPHVRVVNDNSEVIYAGPMSGVSPARGSMFQRGMQEKPSAQYTLALDQPQRSVAPAPQPEQSAAAAPAAAAPEQGRAVREADARPGFDASAVAPPTRGTPDLALSDTIDGRQVRYATPDLLHRRLLAYALSRDAGRRMPQERNALFTAFKPLIVEDFAKPADLDQLAADYLGNLRETARDRNLNAIEADLVVEPDLQTDYWRAKVESGRKGGSLYQAPVQGGPAAFVTAPDGARDWGQITREIARAIGREAAPIRVRRGDETFGLRHVRDRHDADARALGYASVQAMIHDATRNFDAIYHGRGRTLVLAKRLSPRVQLYTQLEPSGDGAFYDVKSATPSREDQFRNKKPLWERAGPSTSPAEAGTLIPGSKEAPNNISPPKPDSKKQAGAAISGVPGVSRVERLAPDVLGVYRLAPQVAAKRAEIEAQLRAIIQRMTGNAAPPVTVTDALFSDNPEATEAVFGVYSPLAHLVAVSIQSPDPIGTVRHETVHILRQLGLIDRQAWRTLVDTAADQDWIGRYDIENRYPGADADLLFEEAIAEAFSKHASWSNLPPAVNAIFRRMDEFFRRVRAALRRVLGQDPDFKDLFTAIERGKFADRKPSAPARTEAAAQTVSRRNDVESSPEFKAWFGDSKVVDEKGRPLVVYHGTKADIEAFDPTKLGDETKHPSAVLGFFFAADPAVANEFAGVHIDAREWPPKRGHVDGANVLPVYLSIKRPFEIPAEKWRSIVWGPDGADRVEWFKKQRALLEKQGYDGMRVVGDPKYRDSMAPEYGTDNWIAFRPEQIKSPSNRGTFNPADARVLFQRAANDRAKAVRDGTPAERKSATLRAALDTLHAKPPSPPARPLPFDPDLRGFQKWMIHPRTIAAMFPAFTPVWNAGVKQFATRDRIAAELIELKEAYDALSLAEKANVNKALELGRLQGETFRPDARGRIVVRNTVGGLGSGSIGGAALTKAGETVILDEDEAKAYLSVRKTMDRALELFRDQMLVDWGFDPSLPDTPKTAREFESNSDRASDAGETVEAERLGKIANVLAEIEMARKRGYVPFTRFGQWYVTVRSGDSDIVHREHFEPERLSEAFAGGQAWVVSPRARRKLAERIEARRRELMRMYPRSGGFTVSRAQRITPKTFDELPSLSDISGLLSAAHLDTATAGKVQEAVDRVIKEMSFRKHFIASRNVPGYSPDFDRTLADYVTGLAGYLGRRAARDDFEDALARVPEAQSKLKRYATDWHEYIQNPREEHRFLRQLAFVYYLSGRISSAVVNMMQVPMITWPYLSQLVDPARAKWHLARAYTDIAQMLSVDAAKKLTIFDPDKAPADVRDDLKKAFADGTLVPLETFQEMAKAHGRTPRGRQTEQIGRKAMDAAALMFSGAERVNRIVSFIAAHRIARMPGAINKANKLFSGNELWASSDDWKTPAGFAKWTVDETQYVQGKLNRPTAMRGIFSLPMQFKGYTLNTLELYWRMWAMHEGAAGKLAVGMSALLLLFMSGLFGIPGGDDLKDAAEDIYKRLEQMDIDLEAELRRLVGGGAAGRIVSRGAARELTGLDVSRRLGMGDILPGGGSWSDDALRQVAPYLGPWYDMMILRPIDVFAAGRRGDALGAAQRAVPEAIGDVLKAAQWAERGVVARSTGRKILDRDQTLPTGEKVSDPSVLARRAIGFQPTPIARATEEYRAIQRAGRAANDLAQTFNTRLAMSIVAEQRGETPEAKAKARADQEKILGEIERHNLTAPEHLQVIPFQKGRPSAGLRAALEREQHGSYATQEKRTPKKARGEVEAIRPLY